LSTNTIVRFRSGVRQLPQGCVLVDAVPPESIWGLEGVTHFLPADEFTLRGLTVRDRQSGLGAPLIAVQPGGGSAGFLRPIPATLFLRVPGDIRSWNQQGLSTQLELYDTYQVTSVDVNGARIPLEGDTSTPLAYGLNDSFVWDIGLEQFFSYEEKIPSDIHFTQPYAPGRIPVVFVHGTFSSPVWWAQMWNTLRNDRRLREHYQFWHFTYNSGNPVAYSAANLRRRILETLEELDPEGKDPALQRMVVIGHSQGGLLTKLTATDTGDKLWRAYFDTDIDSTRLTPEVKEKLREYAFVKPLPSVKRVVFLSTPHRGSYLANQFVRQLARRFMTLPGDIVSLTGALLLVQDEQIVPSEVRKAVPTSLDQMSPSNPYLLTLAKIPVAPGVHAHSIIGVKGHGPVERGGDGVVKYTSAHVDYAESELVLRCGHGTQTQPAAIEEVRRILLEHMDSATAAPAGR
jgi:pimeloyl-ACP methyl ester carboxylesterase